jgi:hypothetical protein
MERLLEVGGRQPYSIVGNILYVIIKAQSLIYWFYAAYENTKSCRSARRVVSAKIEFS